MMNKSALHLAILACLTTTAHSVSATDYTTPTGATGPSKTVKADQLKAGDTVTLLNDSINAGGSNRINIDSSGGIKVSSDGKDYQIFNIIVNGTEEHNLGTGTVITASGGDPDQGITAIDARSQTGTLNLKADQLVVDLKSSDAGLDGLYLGWAPAKVNVDLGTHSSISAHSDNNGADGVDIDGMYKRGDAVFSASELTIDVSGVKNNLSDVTSQRTSAEGLHASNTIVDLGIHSDITVSGNDNAYGVRLGNSSLTANQLTITTTGSNAASSLIMGNGSTADLGSGSHITFNFVKSGTEGTNPYAHIAVEVSDNSSLKADNLSISATETRGLYIDGNSSVDLGSGSTISTTGVGHTEGVTIFDTSVLKADHLTLDAADATALTLQGGIADLGSGSLITSGSTSPAVNINGGTLTANELSVTAENDGAALWAWSTGAATSHASIGEGSTLSANSIALIATDGATVDFAGTPDRRNAIRSGADGAYGVKVTSSSQINLKNTDITVASTGPGSAGIAATGNSVITGENLTITAPDAEAGIMATGSTVSLTGLLSISLAAQEQAALLAEAQSQIDAQGEMTLNGTVRALGSDINLDMASGSQWTGSSAADSNSVLDVSMTNSQWNITGDSTLDALTLSGSDVSMPANQAGTTLTVKGDYAGDNSRLHLNTVLAGDDSATDKLVIGGNATGKTDVMVTNLGGQGDQTVNGIEIVNVGGTADKDAFTNSRAIRAGLFNYSVVQKGSNFYLTSQYIGPARTASSTADITLTGDEPSVQPAPETTGGEPVHQAGQDISTSAGGYIANLAAANQMFVTRLADREGGTEYINPVTGQRDVTSLWLRQEGGHNRSRADSLRTASNRYVAQLGGELVNGSFTDADRWDIGLMAGYANQKGNTTSQRSRYNNDTKSDIHGYSTGLYGTWYQDAKERTGLYVDSWVQYSWFRNSVNEQGQPSDSYSSKGFSASLESGYSWKVVDGERTDFFIQPQAQLVWSGVKADDHRTRTGIHVEGKGENNLQSRLGVKAYLKGRNKIDDNTGRSFKPFVEASWIHNTERYGVRMNGDSLSQDGAKDLAEVKTGMEGQLSSSASVWGGIGVQVGDKGYSDTQGQAGFKYRF